MRNVMLLSLAAAGLLSTAPVAVPGAGAGEPPKAQVRIPEPGVPQVMTMEGWFVRAAYNNEGYVILGYQLANMSVGEPWMLLEVGVALRDRMPDYILPRAAVTLSTPNGKTIPMATEKEYLDADLRRYEMREKVQRDSINYFPPNAYQACRIGFFAPMAQGARAFETVELNNQRACVGRFYFKVPGGIVYGQHWLNVKFAGSLVRVPFRILTKDEEKFLSKNYKDIAKQVKDAFKPKS